MKNDKKNERRSQKKIYYIYMKNGQKKCLKPINMWRKKFKKEVKIIRWKNILDDDEI